MKVNIMFCILFMSACSVNHTIEFNDQIHMNKMAGRINTQSRGITLIVMLADSTKLILKTPRIHNGFIYGQNIANEDSVSIPLNKVRTFRHNDHMKGLLYGPFTGGLSGAAIGFGLYMFWEGVNVLSGGKGSLKGVEKPIGGFATLGVLYGIIFGPLIGIPVNYTFADSAKIQN